MKQEEYEFPETIELDEEAFDEFAQEMADPRPPNAALKALVGQPLIMPVNAAQAKDITLGEAMARAEVQAYETGARKLPRKYGLYDVVMVVLFLLALAALVVSLAACGGGQKCWNAQSPTGGSPGGEKSCRSQQ